MIWSVPRHVQRYTPHEELEQALRYAGSAPRSKPDPPRGHVAEQG